MDKNTKYLLAVMNFDTSEVKLYPGSPHPLSIAEVQAMFGSACSVSQVEVTDAYRSTEKAFFGTKGYTKSTILIQKNWTD